MPIREEPLIQGQIYHIFNKSLDSRRIFVTKKVCNHFLESVKYYRSSKKHLSFSAFCKLRDKSLKEKITSKLNVSKYFYIEILAYCLMPTHFHFLLKQKLPDGISKFIGNISNSFTHYHNLMYNRKGPLFLPRFKSVRIANDPQLLHVSRYIHLNPYSSGNVKKLSDLYCYPWSSFHEYLIEVNDKISTIAQTLYIRRSFPEKDGYKKFVIQNAEYQKQLEFIKHRI